MSDLGSPEHPAFEPHVCRPSAFAPTASVVPKRTLFSEMMTPGTFRKMTVKRLHNSPYRSESLLKAALTRTIETGSVSSPLPATQTSAHESLQTDSDDLNPRLIDFSSETLDAAPLFSTSDPHGTAATTRTISQPDPVPLPGHDAPLRYFEQVKTKSQNCSCKHCGRSIEKDARMVVRIHKKYPRVFWHQVCFCIAFDVGMPAREGDSADFDMEALLDRMNSETGGRLQQLQRRLLLAKVAEDINVYTANSEETCAPPSSTCDAQASPIPVPCAAPRFVPREPASPIPVPCAAPSHVPCNEPSGSFPSRRSSVTIEKSNITRTTVRSVHTEKKRDAALKKPRKRRTQRKEVAAPVEMDFAAAIAALHDTLGSPGDIQTPDVGQETDVRFSRFPGPDVRSSLESGAPDAEMPTDALASQDGAADPIKYWGRKKTGAHPTGTFFTMPAALRAFAQPLSTFGKKRGGERSSEPTDVQEDTPKAVSPQELERAKRKRRESILPAVVQECESKQAWLPTSFSPAKLTLATIVEEESADFSSSGRPSGGFSSGRPSAATSRPSVNSMCGSMPAPSDKGNSARAEEPKAPDADGPNPNATSTATRTDAPMKARGKVKMKNSAKPQEEEAKKEEDIAKKKKRTPVGVKKIEQKKNASGELKKAELKKVVKTVQKKNASGELKKAELKKVVNTVQKKNSPVEMKKAELEKVEKTVQKKNQPVDVTETEATKVEKTVQKKNAAVETKKAELKKVKKTVQRKNQLVEMKKAELEKVEKTVQKKNPPVDVKETEATKVEKTVQKKNASVEMKTAELKKVKKTVQRKNQLVEMKKAELEKVEKTVQKKNQPVDVKETEATKVEKTVQKKNASVEMKTAELKKVKKTVQRTNQLVDVKETEATKVEKTVQKKNTSVEMKKAELKKIEKTVQKKNPSVETKKAELTNVDKTVQKKNPPVEMKKAELKKVQKKAMHTQKQNGSVKGSPTKIKEKVGQSRKKISMV